MGSVLGPCDTYILNFEFYVFVFGRYCFGLAHYRGRVWIILSIRNTCFLWLSLPGHYRVTDETLLAETT